MASFSNDKAIHDFKKIFAGICNRVNQNSGFQLDFILHRVRLFKSLMTDDV